MGEGIHIYGLRNRHTRDLQSFADRVIKIGRPRGSFYIFGKTNKSILNDLERRGIELKSGSAAITDRTILKYRSHPKKLKGATVSPKRFIMVESAVKHPRNVYIDTNRNRLVYVSSVKYGGGKVLKVIIEPNQKIHGKYYNEVKSIGVVDGISMKNPQYVKIK